MFAIVQCSQCRHPRIVDLDVKVSSCTYCGNTDTNANMRVICRTRTQEKAREELFKLTSPQINNGFDGETVKLKKHAPRKSIDPWSSLEREYEQAHGVEQKMIVLSRGLTDYLGEFTEEDVLRLDPKNGSKLLALMLERCIVHETSYGRYKR